MKSQYFLPALILMMFVSGCENVTSKYLVGQKPYTAKLEEWVGDWSPDCSSEEMIKIEVIDKDKGIIRVSQVKTNPESTVDSIECYLREAGEWVFANAKLKGEADYYPVRVRNVNGRQIIAWFPDPEKFRLLVEQKALPGELHGRDISLGLLKPEHLELITSDRQGVLFKWDEPSVLIRHGEPPSPRN